MRQGGGGPLIPVVRGREVGGISESEASLIYRFPGQPGLHRENPVKMAAGDTVQAVYSPKFSRIADCSSLLQAGRKVLR